MSDARELVTGGVGTLSGIGALLASMGEGDVSGWIERVGFPVAALCAIGWAGLRFTRWLGARVVEPIATGHVNLMTTLARTSEENTEALKAIAASEASTLECVRQLRASVDEERRTSRLAVDGVREAIDRLGRAMDAA